MRAPRLNEFVDHECVFCHKVPKEGDTYGPGPKQWDYANICPECWDKVTKEPES